MKRDGNQARKTRTNENKKELNMGDEIRAVRKARQLTLKELSKRTGRSVAYLSRIELGEARISVDLLTDIGTALNVDPKWFFPSRTGTGNHERSCVVRADSRRPLSNLYTRTSEELGFNDELLSSSIAGQCYMLISHFPPTENDNNEAREGYVFEGEMHGIIIKGCVELTLEDEVIQLNAGDSFSFSSQVPHRLRNCIHEESIMISTMTPVRITW